MFDGALFSMNREFAVAHILERLKCANRTYGGNAGRMRVHADGTRYCRQGSLTKTRGMLLSIAFWRLA